MDFENDLKIDVLGESLFSTWCAEAQLTSNPSSNEDRYGWDHYVEFPYLHTTMPRDLQSSPIECKIQVKSTQRRDRKWAIKLSVLKRLIDFNNPAFVLIYEFSKGHNPVLENTFLVHIDKKIIYRVLQKIRKNDTSSTSNDLHNIKLTISYNAKHLLSDNTGVCFREKVVSNIPEVNIAKYQQSKRTHLETVGYEKDGHVLKFKAPVKLFTEHILNSALGLPSSLDVRDSSIFDNRFNLKEGSVEIECSDTAKITVYPREIDKCIVRIKDDEFSPSLDFKGEFLSVANLFEKTNDLLIRTTLFSFKLITVNKDGDYAAKLYMTIEKQATLDEVCDFYNLFGEDNLNKQLYMDIHLINNDRILNFPVKLNYNISDTSLANISDSIKSIKNYFGIDGDIMTTVNEVFSDRDRIHTLAAIINNDLSDFNITLKEVATGRKERVITPLILFVQFGTIVVGVSVLLHCDLINEKNYGVFQADLIQKLIFQNGMPKQALIDKLYSNAYEELKSRIV